MIRRLGYLPVTLTLIVAPVAVMASDTCDDIPDLREDSAGWNLPEQESEAVNALIDQAESLCTQGKGDEATKLLDEAQHEAVQDWRNKMRDSSN